MSPLPITGTGTAAATSPIRSHEAFRWYRWLRVRPWTKIAWTPASSAAFATSTWLSVSSFHPSRILT